MKKRIYIIPVLAVLFLLTIAGSRLEAQTTVFDVTPVNGKYSFSYNQAPDNIVPFIAVMTGATYQWESSTSADPASFTPIAGTAGQQASLVFTAPLAQTTYFRRKTSLFLSFAPSYSNIVKINVVSANWENLNYVKEHEVLVAGQTDWKAIDALPIGQQLETATFQDGLGRPVQKISRETATPASASPNTWGDIVEFYKYDAFGRESTHNLPYTTTTAPGKYKSGTATDQPAYYSTVYNETSAYSSSTYDNSPLNRVTNVKAPGTSWAAGTGNSAAYDMNDATDNVRIWTVTYISGGAPVDMGAYPERTLYKTTYTDENGKKVVEYRDNAGELILKKIQIADTPTDPYDGWICTYSVFNDFGTLCFQLQPEAVKYLAANSWSFAGTNGQKVLDELCFRYEHDDKQRSILKKSPGAALLNMIYDSRDRLVFAQDGNQRAKSPAEWTATLYDELDRPTLTTLYHTTKTVATLQSDINNAATVGTVSTTNPGVPVTTLVVDEREAGASSYAAQAAVELVPGFESNAGDNFTVEINSTATTPPVTVATATYKNPISSTDLNNTSISTIIKYYFYDDYSYSNAKQFRTNFDNSLAYSTGADPIAATARVKSMSTGVRVRVLGTNIFLTTSAYYDEKGRAIQQVEDNIKNGEDVTTLQYQFDGRLLSTNTIHTAVGTGYSEYSVVTKNVFDKIGRVSSIQKKYGTNTFKTISEYAFDDLGRLKNKRLDPGYTGSGKSELESLAYSYNLHGQLNGINKDYALKTPGKYSKWGNFFGLYMGRDNRDNVFANANLNGQIAGTLWTTMGDDAQRKYDFTYDNAGRLSNASFNERQTTGDTWSNAKMNFSVTGTSGKIGYDLNGNLLSMIQKGVLPGTASPVNIDDLQYVYTSLSNKLVKVTDNGTAGTSNGKLGDFADGSNGAANDYVYDDNGNLVIDLNKNAKDLAGVAGANGIRYNFLDKPEEIHITGKGTIRIVYDADGSKLQRSYTPESGTASTVTYINEYVYKGDDLQYINFEEGRIRVMQAVSQSNGYDALAMDGNMDLPGGKRGAYDYFIRDYQENVRMILTEEVHTGSNVCTMETARAANEEKVFGKVDANGNPASGNEVQARFAVSGIPGQSSGDGWQNANIGSYVSRIGALAGSKIGPNTLLKVMAGDQVSATTIYYYQNPVTNTAGSTTLLTNLLASLTQAIAGSPAASALAHGAAGSITSALNGNVPFTGAVAPDAGNASGTNPKAYLSVIFFDERFNFVSEGSATVRVSQAGDGAPALVLANVKAPKNGYAYVYVSNESNEMVYFDNLQVSHVRGRIIEEDHYYAYGLKIAGISSKKMGDAAEGALENDYLYNDKELFEDADLDWYDYGFRNYDAQTGRFVQQDPLSDDYAFFSPYHYASDDPITNVDVDGLLSEEPWKVLQEVVVVGKRASPTVLSVAGNFLKGFGSSLWGTVKGVVSAVAHPINTVVGIANAIASPIQTGRAIGHVVAETYHAFMNGNANRRAEILGHATGEIAQMFIGAGEAKAAAEAATLAREAEAVSKAAKIAKEAEVVLLKGAKEATKGVSVIGPRATYREVAKKIGANFLDVTDEAWTMRKNIEFLQGVVKRGDDVIFSGKFNPAKLDPSSVLGQEIKYLQRHGYSWVDDFSGLIKK